MYVCLSICLAVSSPAGHNTKRTQTAFHTVKIPDEPLGATTIATTYGNKIAPGEGPSKDTRDNGYFWIDFIAKAQVDGKDIVSRGKAGSDKGDCNYKETAKVKNGERAFDSQPVIVNQSSWVAFLYSWCLGSVVATFFFCRRGPPWPNNRLPSSQVCPGFAGWA